jgi:hypothetical protein
MFKNIEEEIEGKIIDSINLSAGGRLVIFKTPNSIFGTNLAVEKKGNYKVAPYNFEIISFVGPSKDNAIVKDISVADFKAANDLYFLFVYFDKIKQKIYDYVWLIPSTYFQDITDVIKGEDGKKYYHFQASADKDHKDKYSKFLVDIKELGKIIFDSFGKGGKIEFKETIYKEAQFINKERLAEFIEEARQNTFANNATEVDSPRLLGSSQLEFQKGDYFYRDIYFTGNKYFVGQEVVYLNAKPIWITSYKGSKLDLVQTNFLRESLYRLAGKCRLGKACEYAKREYKYKDSGSGDIDNFLGQEKISIEDKDIYKLDYQGGLISDTL